MQNILFLIGLLSCSLYTTASNCSSNFSESQLLKLKAVKFKIESDIERNKAAVKLISCVGHPNPEIRDGVVYEAMSHWLRNGQLATNTIKIIFKGLLETLSQPNSDKQNFTLPFAALIFAEVVRVDRITPYLTKEQRQQSVDTITSYMNSIDDYRGFSSKSGWRHSVAHSADVLLQLALNKAVSKAQLSAMLDSIKNQISPSKSHFYTYGEPKRLATAFVYIVLTGEIADKELKLFFESTSDPKPFKSWGQVYQSQSGLAKLHNTRSFYYSLLAIAGFSEHPQLQQIQPLIKESIKRLG